MRAINRFLVFFSLALVALMVACGGGGSNGAPPPPEPVITSFTADKTTIALGKSASLTAVYSNGTGTLAPGYGAIPSGQPIAVNPAVTTSYILTVTNAANSTAARTLTINVVPPISNVSFTASKSSISTGESVALTATFSGASSAAVTNNVTAASVTPVSGVPFLVSPTATTTYTLTLTNAAGETETRGLIVTVQGAPAISAFTATPAIISQGGSSTLNYAFSGGVGSINNGVGPVASGLTTAVSPNVTTTYLLTVSNGAGASAISAVTVTVTGFPAVVLLQAERNTITLGDSTRLTATFSSGTGVISNNQNATLLTPVSGVPLTVTPVDNTSYILTVTNGAGGTTTAVTTITVVGAPNIIGFTGSPTPITVGSSSNLTATFSNGTGSINNGVGTVQSGVPVRVSPPTSTSYLLTVTNAAGLFVQRSLTITVVDAPQGISLVAVPPVITIGGSANLIATFTNGTGVVDNGVLGVQNGVPRLVTPLVTTTYTLTVTNPAGARATTGCTVTVVQPPSITSFLSNPVTPPPVAAGTPVQLLPVFINGTGYINGVGSVQSGQSYVVNPLETTTYTLTVTNAAGVAVTAVRTIHVVPDPVITSFTASPNPITAGQTTLLTGIFSGDIPGGSAVINPGGIAATSGIPVAVSPLVTTTYTLTVTNAALVSVNRSVTVTVIGAPVASSLTSTVNPITAGDTTFLIPTFSAGTGVVSPAVGAVLSGQQYAVQPAVTTTYTLTVTNPLGVTDSVIHTVTVLSGPNAAALVANPTGITVGSNTYLTAFFTIGTGGTASVVCTAAADGGTVATSGLAAAVVPVNAVPFVVTPTAPGSYVYTLTVTNSALVTSTHGVTVRVYGPPTAAIGITAGSNNPITVGETTSLTPIFTNGTGVINGIGAVTTGQNYPVSPTVTTTYVLTVTNPVGATATASVTVVVLAGPYAQGFYFLPNVISEGDTTQLYALYTNATTATIASNAGLNLAPSAMANGTFTSGTPIPVTSAVAPSAGIFTYTLSVTNAALTTYTTTANITVVPKPSLVALNVTSPAGPAPYTITAGQSATLAPVFTGGNGVINNGVGPVASGSSYVVTPTVSTTYTLTVTNAAGFAVTASETIFVVAGPFAQALTADPLTVTVGTDTYLTAVFNMPIGGTATVDSATPGAGPQVPVSTPTLQTGVPFRVRPATVGALGAKIYSLTVNNGAGVSHTTGITVRVVEAPTAVTLTASALSIGAGESVTLTPSWTGGPDCVGVLSGGGMSQTVVSGVAYSFNPGVTTTYVLTVTNGAGSSASASVTITVIQPPSITLFEAVPAIITAGGSTQLFATFSNATVGPNVVNPGAIAAVSGTPISVSPAATTVYVLSVVGLGGSTSRHTTVTVVAAPDCNISAEASPLVATTPGHIASVPIQPGSTYNWTITNGTITAGFGTNQITYTVGAATGVGVFGLGVTVTNAALTSCSNAITRDVNAVPALVAPALTSSDGDDTITAGTSVNLLPVFSGGVNPVGVINPTVGPVVSGLAYTVTPAVTTTYNLTVTDAVGQTASASRTITVVPAVTITSFAASRNPVTIGAATVLTPVFNNPNPAVGGNQITHGDGAGNPASPIVPTSGSGIPYIPGTLGAQTHTLTQTNLAGQTATRTLVLNVVAAPVATSLVAAPATITSGQSSTLTPTFTDGTGIVSGGVGTVISLAGYPVTPATTTTYTLTVTNAAGDTAVTQATVTVLSGPNAISLLASRRTITIGDTINLTATFINGTALNGLTGSAGSFSLGQLPATPSSGTPVAVTPTALGTMTYSLLVTNGAGTTDLETVTVDVVPAPTAALNQVGGPAPITAGETTQLRPIFTGGTGAVTPVIGAVENLGLYSVTPGATTTYQLTVTNAAGMQAFAQRTITVLSGPLATSFTASPTIVTAGGTTSLTAVFSGAGALGSVDNGVGAVVSGVPASSAALAATTTFSLTVTNGAGTTVTRTVTVLVVPAPTATSLVATPATINQGQTSVLVPTFSNGTGTVTGIGGVVSGASYTVAPGSTTTYTLIVTNPAGTTASTTATVTVLAGPNSSSFTVLPAPNISLGDTVTMNWVYSLAVGGTGSILRTDDTGAVSTLVALTPATTPGSGTNTPAAIAVPPYGLFTYTLRLIQGTTTVDRSVSVMVWDLPTATIAQTAPSAAAPSPFSIAAGTPVTLQFTFTGNTTARVFEEVTGAAWIISSGDTITEPSAPVAGQQRRYRLTVTNPATGAGANTVYIINSI